MKPYQAYKDSEVEWLGEIPKGWISTKLKRATQFLYGNSLPNECRLEGNFSVFGSNGIVGFHNESITNNPCIIIGRKGSFGKINYSSKKCFPIDTTYFIDDSATKQNIRWLYYILQTLELDVISKDSAVPGLSREDTYEKLMFLPPIQEQTSIVTFLDQKTQQIDRLIEIKQKQVKLLKEQRTAIINQAVTRGLNPNVPMKDSGIEWLGEIPRHWKTVKLKFVCSLLRDGTHLPPPRTDIGILLLSVRNIVNGKFINLPDDSLISEEDYEKLRKSFDVFENDILLAIVGATLGKVAIVENMPPFAIQRSLAVFRTIAEKTHYKYLHYFFSSSLFQNLLWNNVGFSAQPGIYLGALANFHSSLPPIEEQHFIVSFLDEKTQQIDQLTESTQIQISQLQEYRTSLISSVVTGKIDVRDYVVENEKEVP